MISSKKRVFFTIFTKKQAININFFSKMLDLSKTLVYNTSMYNAMVVPWRDKNENI